MKIRTVTLILALGLTATLAAQQRRPRPKPQPATQSVPATSPTPQASPTPDTRRKAVLSMKEGDPISGLFIKADSTNAQLEVAGNIITVPTEKIASIDFAEKKETAKPADETPSLAIEAAVIYNFGGAQPLARKEIALLDASLPQILREAGLHGGDLDVEENRAFRQRNPSAPDFSRYSPRKPDTDATLLNDLVSAIEFPTLGDGQFLGKAIPAIKAHIVITGTTDFSGKLELKDLKPGNYFVYLITQTRSGYALWNVPLEIKAGRNSLSIDNTNAAIAF
jgi:hypothetical protein